MAVQSEDAIAVVGIGCRFPGGVTDPHRLWNFLKHPDDLAAEPKSERFNMGAFHVPGQAARYGAINVNKGFWLEQDPCTFDAAFFDISPVEATFMDPQQRILLETVYEALEHGGFRLEDLRGSLTGVYCGAFNQDYAYLAKQEPDRILPLMPTGHANSILSNRVSYVFDWKGPSITIDTACAASLTAVHLAANALRSGECSLAIAAGSNVMLSPDGFQSMSQMRILSDDGYCRMWDEGANGFARGEGVAAIILKRLSHALRDGDEISCIIRATAVGADGRNEGLTAPNSDAQLELIRATYERAGLDPLRPGDRCQYLEAHGTGTQIGDPKEAHAVRRAFFDQSSGADEVLHVGSIKTVFGHLEATAGLAGLIKALLAVKHGVIPPNLHFHKVNADIAPHMDHLRVPTTALPWPKLPPGEPRRASINAFGFGGSNAHVILESFTPDSVIVDVVDCGSAVAAAVVPLPFFFSANSQEALKLMIQRHLQFIRNNPAVDGIDLATSLITCRSLLAHRLILQASSVQLLAQAMQGKLDSWADVDVPVSLGATKQPDMPGKTQMLGIFTGQGAQWPQMGRDLIASSPKAQIWLGELQRALDSLPQKYQPRFKLWEQLAAPENESRIHEAGISLTLRTALQIVQVNILRALGIEFAAVVGHSSGEIPAAYAARRLSSAEAIRIAYLRGLSTEKTETQGAMLAAGISWEQAQAVCSSEPYSGRVAVSAYNSPLSVTLSGDADKIRELEWLLISMDLNAKALHVDKAYHSHHMQVCAEWYVMAMKECGVAASQETTSTVWFSSVFDGQEVHDCSDVEYWKDNMVRPVLFSQAVAAAFERIPNIKAIVEVGPHPTLKGPAMQTLSHFPNGKNIAGLPYIEMAKRNENGLSTLQRAVGNLWTCASPNNKLDILSYIRIFDPARKAIHKVPNLPLYPFDHSRSYGGLSRVARVRLHRKHGIHPLLGSMSCEAAQNEWRWRHHLRLQDIDWLEDYQMESQVILPVAAIIAIANEAAIVIAGDDSIQSVTIEQLVMHNAIAIPDGDEGVETMLTIDTGYENSPVSNGGSIHGRLAYYSAFGDDMRCCCSGRIRIALGRATKDLLGLRGPPVAALRSVDAVLFYREIAPLGYGYSRGFKGLADIQRRKDAANAFITSHGYHRAASLDPVALDVGLQSVLAIMGAPGDGQINSLHLPVRIGRIVINAAFCAKKRGLDQGKPEAAVESVLTCAGPDEITSDIDIFDTNGARMVQIEDFAIVSLKTAQLDTYDLFASTVWMPQQVSASTDGATDLPYYRRFAKHMDHVAVLYLQEISRKLTPADRAGLDLHRQRYVAWMDRLLSQTAQGTHPFLRPEDLDVEVQALGITGDMQTNENMELVLLNIFRDKALSWLRGQTTALEHLWPQDMLARYYRECEPIRVMNAALADSVGQIAFLFPRMKILEIGAGTGSATRETLKRLAGSYSTYTFTDISSGFFEAAEQEFEKQGYDRVEMKTLDIGQDPASQGFLDHAYDLIIAANVLHATRSLRQTLSNVRQLLKPGGYLVMLEITCPDVVAPATMAGTFEGWWAGHGHGRPFGPLVTAAEWERLLPSTGFDGLEAISSKEEQEALRMAVMVAQATDNHRSCIKSPLSAAASAQYADLIVVGGMMSTRAALLEPLLDLVRPFFARITVSPSLEQLSVPDNANLASVLVLSGAGARCLDCDMTDQRLDGLKRLVRSMGKLLWVCVGSDDELDLPYSQMSRALMACLRCEYPQHMMQHLVVSQDDAGPHEIASFLMQLVHQKLPNDYTMQHVVTCLEPELRMEDGVVQVPRIRHEYSMAQRLRASRGQGTEQQADPRLSRVLLTETANQVGLVALPDLKHGNDVSGIAGEKVVRVRVCCATIPAVRIARALFLHVVVGRDEETGQRVLALAPENASVIHVHNTWVCPAPAWLSRTEVAAYTEHAANTLILADLIKNTPSGTTMMVHGLDMEPSQASGSVQLSNYAEANSVKLCHVRTSAAPGPPDVWTIPPWLHSRAILRQLPSNVSTFVNFTSPVNDSIAKLESILKSNGVAIVNVGDMLRSQASGAAESRTASAPIFSTIAPLISESRNLAKRHVEAVSVQELCHYTARRDKMDIIDWDSGDTIAAKTMPASSLIGLSGQKTYVLCEMTGEMGQSVCQWLIEHGAQFVVLGSRTPNIDVNWIKEMAQLGGRVLGLKM